MALPPEQLTRLLNHLTEKTNGNFPNCPICNHSNWAVDGPIVMLGFNEELQSVIGGKGAPAIVMTCTHCFFIRQFAWDPILKKKVTFELPIEKGNSNV